MATPVTQVYLRDDQAHITLDVDGVEYGNGDSWLTYAGAGLTAAGAKTRAGGMGKEKELGGPATRAAATLTIQNGPVMVGTHAKLESRIGKGRAVATLHYLDDDGVRIPGARFSVAGKLLGAELPGQNGENATAGMYTVVIGCDEVAV